MKEIKDLNKLKVDHIHGSDLILLRLCIKSIILIYGVLVPLERDASIRKHSSDAIELEFNTATQPGFAPHVSESIGKAEVIVLAGVIQPDDLREIGPLLHNGSKEDYV